MKIDMAPHAITMRLKKTSELRRLCIALGGDRLKKKLQSDKTDDTISNKQSGSVIKTITPDP